MLETTKKFETHLASLFQNSRALELKIRHLDEDLKHVHQDLDVVRVVSTKLNELDSSLKLASELLSVASFIPEIGPAAEDTKLTLDEVRKPITEAARIAKKAEAKIKPVRKKVGEAEKKVAKVDGLINRAMDAEYNLLYWTRRAESCVVSLPQGFVQDQSAKNLDALSGKADPPVVAVDKVQVKVLKTINGIDSKMQQVKKSVQGLVDIKKGIDAVLETLAPLISALKAVKMVLEQEVSVPYGGYPKMCTKSVNLVFKTVHVPYPCGWHTVYFSFSVKQVLEGGLSVISPVMNLLEAAMHAVLDPVLNKLESLLGIRLPEIPGIHELKVYIDSIPSVFDPIYASLDDLLKSMENLRAELKDAANAYVAPFKKAYEGCVKYKGEHEPMLKPGPGVLASVDPEFYDALCVRQEFVYLFKGPLFWRLYKGKTTVDPPKRIQGNWGSDKLGKPIKGPFDAVCLLSVDDRFGNPVDCFFLFRGKSHWLFTEGKGSGPWKFEGDWGVTGPIDAACVIDNEIVFFKGDQFWYSPPGAGTFSYAYPIKGNWGNDQKGKPLTGPFDAVAVHGKGIQVRKGKQFWEVSLVEIRNGLRKLKPPAAEFSEPRLVEKKAVSKKAVSKKAVSKKAVSKKAVSKKAVSKKAVSKKAVRIKAVRKRPGWGKALRKS